MTRYKKQTEFINEKDIMFAVATNIISITILFLPRYIADNTVAADGWLTIVFGGFIAIIFAWILAKIASSFPNQSFLSFASYLVSRPFAIVLSILFIVQYITISFFQIREIATLSHEYLFDRTPLEVVCLAFILVVIYAVSGSRAAIFRLNILFFPFVIVGLLLLIFFPMGAIKIENLLPVFETDLKGIMQGTTSSLHAFLGFSIVLFYISLVKNPKKTPKMTVIGILWPFFFYIVISAYSISIFFNKEIHTFRERADGSYPLPISNTHSYLLIERSSSNTGLCLFLFEEFLISKAASHKHPTPYDYKGGGCSPFESK